MKLLAAALAAPALGSLINVEINPSSEYFELSSNATITCKYSFNQDLAAALSEAPAYALTWSKNGKNLVSFSTMDNFEAIAHHNSNFDTSSVALDQEASSSTLSLNDVAIEDRGNFACSVQLLKAQAPKEFPEQRAYYSNQAQTSVEVYRLPTASAELNASSFDTRNDQVNGDHADKKHVIASCGISNAYPAPQSIALQVGNRQLSQESVDFTAVADEFGIFSVHDIEFNDSLQGVNDNGASVACLAFHEFWGAEPIKSEASQIEVLYLPESVEVVYDAGDYAIEGQDVAISCEAMSNPNVNLELHKNGYVAPPAPEVVLAEVLPEAVEEPVEEAEEEAEESEEEAEEESDDDEAEAEDEGYEYDNEYESEASLSRRRRNATEVATEAPAVVSVAVINQVDSRKAVRGESIQYQCRAFDAQFNFELLSAVRSLPVFYMDAPTLSGPTEKISPDTNVDLTCSSNHATGDNQVTYTLFKDGEDTKITSATGVFSLKAEEAEFSCSASVDVVGLEAQVSNSVTVELKNVCQYRSEKVELIPEVKGEDLVSTLICPLQSESENCDITWFYDKDAHSSKPQGKRLVITNLVLGENERIYCYAENDAGLSHKLYLEPSDVKPVEPESNTVVTVVIVLIVLTVIYVAFAKYRSKKNYKKKMAAAAEESVSLN